MLTLQQLIQQNIIPQIEQLSAQVIREKEHLTLDGVKAFNDVDMFVPGKVVNAFSYLLVNTDRNSHEYPRILADFREVVEFTAKFEMKTWGIFFYLTCLDRLNRHGLLHEAVSEETLQLLKAKLDWRKFIREADLSLINLPTNYYGCGLGVARFRVLLGWEPESTSAKLFDKLMDHIEQYSGELGFSDETPGEGRFDRYTVLLPGELCARLVDTGMEVPEKLRVMLRKSCDIHLMLANEAGDGFAYGRTIGAYGDTSILEVLSIAAYLDILSEAEKELAYAYCTKITEKFIDFWIDREMGSVNLWEKGRKSDSYMNKNRILGENLNLCFQHIHTAEIWAKAGFKDKTPVADFGQILEKLPKHYFVKFAEGDYDRGLVIIRDQQRIINLPLINGGEYQYQHTPYFPIPQGIGLIAGSPGEKHANLLPKITLTDGSVLMPLAYLKEILPQEDGDSFQISFRLDEWCLMGEKVPRKDQRVQSTTTYTFKPGMVMREELLEPNGSLQVSEIYLELGTYSQEPEQEGNTVRFRHGALYEVELTGLEECVIEPVSGNVAYHTPHGALQYKISWRKPSFVFDKPLKLQWVLKYH